MISELTFIYRSKPVNTVHAFRYISKSSASLILARHVYTYKESGWFHIAVNVQTQI